jgi:hypothetical protein
VDKHPIGATRCRNRFQPRAHRPAPTVGAFGQASNGAIRQQRAPLRFLSGADDQVDRIDTSMRHHGVDGMEDNSLATDGSELLGNVDAHATAGASSY